MNCQCFRMLWPTLPNGPDSGSMNATRTVWPASGPAPALVGAALAGAAAGLAAGAGLAGACWAQAEPARAKAAARVTCLIAELMELLLVGRNAPSVKVLCSAAVRDCP